MRARLAAITIASVGLTALTLTGASAASMNVTMSPSSGPSGTTVSASSNDTCAAKPTPPSGSNLTYDGPVVLWSAVAAGSPAPADDSGDWDAVIASDQTAEEGDTPWSGTFKLGEESGQFAKAPGAYTIWFSCGYYETAPPTPGLPRTDGPPKAYGDKTPKPFQVCQSGTSTCASTAGTTTTTSTTIAATTTTTAAGTSATTTTTNAASAAPTAKPGQSLDVTANGYKPNSSGTIDFESTPVRVGTFTADANGNVAAVVKVPANAPAGQHHIVLTGIDPSGATRTLRQPITVAGTALVRTGSPGPLLLVVALVLGAFGVVLRSVTGDLRRARGDHMA